MIVMAIRTILNLLSVLPLITFILLLFRSYRAEACLLPPPACCAPRPIVPLEPPLALPAFGPSGPVTDALPGRTQKGHVIPNLMALCGAMYPAAEK